MRDGGGFPQYVWFNCTDTVIGTGGYTGENCPTPPMAQLDYTGFAVPRVTAPIIRTGVATNVDLAGKISLAAGSGTYTFLGTYTTAPVCVANDTTALANVQVVTTTTKLTLTGTGTDVVNYACFGLN